MKRTGFRQNPYTAKDFHTKAAHNLQVAADMAIEGLARDPTNEGFYWVKPLANGGATGVDLFAGAENSLLKARGDLSRLDSTLIPEGGVVCPAGSFMMGSRQSDPEHREDEIYHQATLTRSFGLGKYPVTQGLYYAVTGEIPAKVQSDPYKAHCPMTRLSWYTSVRFCNRLSEMLGLDPVYTITGEERNPHVTCERTCNGFRLPTEAEWEYAARCGGDPFVYAGSNDPDEVSWHSRNSRGLPHAVGLKKPTRWGLYDMNGNVWEWCEDKYAAWLEDSVDYVNAGSGLYRVSRGGSWNTALLDMGVARRWDNYSSDEYCDLGFRLCRTLSSR